MASNRASVCRRVGRMLDALSEVNNWVAEGDLEKEVYNFKVSVIRKLSDEGWSVTCPKEKYVVRAPKNYGDRVGVKGVK